jgi:predicted nucleotidyltransferase
MVASLKDLEPVRRIAAEFPALKLLVLHGSRARADAHVRSDWDFVYLADGELDDLELRSRLCDALGTERIDLADLSRAGGLLRYRAAREGLPLFERQPEEFVDFCLKAASFWYDIERIVREEHEAILDDLG